MGKTTYFCFDLIPSNIKVSIPIQTGYWYWYFFKQIDHFIITSHNTPFMCCACFRVCLTTAVLTAKWEWGRKSSSYPNQQFKVWVKILLLICIDFFFFFKRWGSILETKLLGLKYQYFDVYLSITTFNIFSNITGLSLYPDPMLIIWTH